MKKTLALALALAMPMAACADDVSDQIAEALNAYKANNLEATVTALDAAATLVRQKRAGAIAEVLPKPLAGWVSEQEETTTAGAAMLGGGVTAERTYREQKEDGKQVSITITADSPMLQSMAMLFSNPMYLGSQKQKLVVLDGRKVIQDSGEGSLTTMVNNKVLVVVRAGSSDAAAQEAVKSYFKAVDFKKLEGMVK